MFRKMCCFLYSLAFKLILQEVAYRGVVIMHTLVSTLCIYFTVLKILVSSDIRRVHTDTLSAYITCGTTF